MNELTTILSVYLILSLTQTKLATNLTNYTIKETEKQYNISMSGMFWFSVIFIFCFIVHPPMSFYSWIVKGWKGEIKED